MDSKNIQGCIIFLIFFIICLVIIHYSKNSINFVKEFFKDNDDEEPKNISPLKGESKLNGIIIQKHKNIIEENVDQETYPLEGIDYNNICPHYDGQYYAYDDSCRPCQPGEKVDLLNKKCIQCPVNTYSNERNSLNCKPCSEGMITDNKIGQSNCVKQKKYKMKNIDNLIGGQHSVMKTRMQIQKEQDTQIKKLKGQVGEIMNSIDMIKEVDNPLDYHK